MPNFTTGATEAEKASRRTAMEGRAAPFTIKAGQTKWVRMLTDIKPGPNGLITIDTHVAVPTREKPKDFRGPKWPSNMSVICANATAFRIHDSNGIPTDEFEEGYGHCYVHENFQGQMSKFNQPIAVPTSQVYALCALRELITNDDGRPTGIRDTMEEYKDDKGSYQVPAIRLMAQRYQSFYGPMAAAAFMSGTILNRDFMIKRVENDYEVVGQDVTEDLRPGTEKWERYTKALELMKLSLPQIIADLASLEFSRRWFDPSYKFSDDGEEGGSEETGTSPAEGQPQVDDAEVQAMRERLRASASTGAPASGSSG
jgi:hypothetical protein